MSYSVDTVLVIGLGLIGGSFARGVRTLPRVQRVIGFDLNREECELALALEVVDEIAADLETAVKQADLVMLAVPVKAIERVLETIIPWLKPDALITDVGSTKLNVVAAAERLWTSLPAGFIPGHPIAGAEKSGVAASDAGLFQHRKVILTPLAGTDPDATLTLARLWQSLGSEVLQMEPRRHDEVLAATSHLPHLLAFSLVDTLAAEAESTDIFRYAAGGFRDFTRIAASDPTMWHDVCFANRAQLLVQIDRYIDGLQGLRAAIDQGDGQRLLGIFTRARASREHFSRILERAGYSHASGDEPESIRVKSSEQLSGRIRVPGDRSISHRAIMLAAIADGISDIDGFIESEDSLATIQVFRDLGVVIEGPHQGRVRVYGVGLHGLQAPTAPLYFGNSITSLRMLLGLLAAQPFDSEIIGSRNLSSHSVTDVIEPLLQMGARISAAEGHVPLSVSGAQTLSPLRYEPNHASAQVKAALLMAAMSAGVDLELFEPHTTRDHTERLLSGFGVELERDGRLLRLGGEVRLRAQAIQIPADLSLASAFALAVTLLQGSQIVIEHSGVNPTRMRLLRILGRMGARIEAINPGTSNGEPIADLQVYSADLVGIDCTSTELAGVGDELPLLLVAMAFAQGESQLSGLDRLPARQLQLLDQTLCQLQRIGTQVERGEHELTLRPGEQRVANELNACEHPLLALALIVVCLVSQQECRITGCRTLSSVFPEYVDQARRIGIRLSKEH